MKIFPAPVALEGRIASFLRPLSAFLLVLAFGPLCATAQTRLNANQVPTLAGAVQGPANSSTLRDIVSAKDHGNGTTNGIQSAIVACGTTTACPITVPYFYPLTETVPGYALDPNNPDAPGNTPGNITIFDQRYGDARMANNPKGYTDSLLTTPNGWVYNYSAKQSAMAILSPLYILQNSFDGGTNNQQSSLNYYDKTTWTPLQLQNYSHTPGQHVSATVNTSTFSIGDSLGIANYINCYGGFNAQADEGCEAQDNQVYMGNVAYGGTLTGIASTGATSVTVNPSQGANTQGAGRFLIDKTTGVISAGTISAINTGSGLTTLTGSGTSWPVSTTIAQLGTAVSTPGTATVTPASFTVGSISNITTSTLLCIADPESFELVVPSAVTSTTFTAKFAKAHLANATIAAGGVCGYVVDLTADDVTNSTFPTKNQSITGTLRFAWPAVTSTSATSMQMYVAGGGGYQTLVSRWSSSANGYVLYPAAEVTSVQQNGYLSNTLALSPNGVKWTSGDSVEELLYPAVHVNYGNTVLESYYPNFPNAGGGYSLNFNMPLQGNDAMLQLNNNAPISMYQNHGGTYASPWGIHVSGQTRYGLMVDNPSDQWTFGVGCASPCTQTVQVMGAGNGKYYDFLDYNEALSSWVITANSAASQYTFQSYRFSTPFGAVGMGSDPNSIGYVDAPSFRTGTASNTDSGGELALSNATSATYTMQGSYSSHPECIAEPQFDPGASNRHWITYTGNTSFTINFATPVTGSVSYVCIAHS